MMAIIQTINPATEKPFQCYTLLNKQQVNAKIMDAHQCYLDWRQTTLSDRCHLVRQVALKLRQNQAQYARLMANEMGKPVTQGGAEIEKCAWLCEHYAEYAPAYLAPEGIQTQAYLSEVVYQPLGVIFAIMPWNFPFWQVLRFAIPALLGGNTAILKHAPISFGSGHALEQLFLEAGFLQHAFQHVMVDNDGAASIIAHDAISGVTLTGSEQAGRAVAAQAGQYLKRVVLELGGNDPYVILADADLDNAADCIVKSRLNNSGQICIAAKRVIAVESVVDQLLEKIQRLMAAYQMGDPLDPQTLFGPLARGDLRDTLHAQVLLSVKKGAKLHLGGEIPSRAGYYYPPTLLTQVKPGMPAFDEELFGPVIALVSAKNEQDAIALANQSRFGLGGAVFTRNLARGEVIARQEIETGVCYVNNFVSSDPRLPFGGIKQSGFGRELAKEGIRSFMNTKTVVIAK